MTMLRRWLRGTGSASVIGVLLAALPPGAGVARADGDSGSCWGTAGANASTYDGSATGSSSGDVTAGGYSNADCTGLAQTNAIFQAGLACESAGIPAGVLTGAGYAVVTWTREWVSDAGDVVTLGPIQQQYDCGDTFS
jgi:hypothetical protein